MAQLISSNPATGEKIAEYSPVGEQEILDVLNKSQQAFVQWRKTSMKHRIQFLKKLRTVLVEHSCSIAEKISKEQGKFPSEAIGAEIIPVLDTLKYLEKSGKKELAPTYIDHYQMLFSHKKAAIHYQPYGVISMIAPWNFPFSLPFIPALEAIFAGNSVVLKPSPFTPAIAFEIKKLFDLAGLPENVFQVVVCEDSMAPVLVDNDITRKIFFTGSVATGKKVMQTAAKRLLPVVLELGGKDPAIVTQYADLDKTAAGVVWGAFMNAGQICASIERVFVEKKVYSAFLNKLEKEWANVQIGPMIHEQQKDIVVSHVQDAITKGARLLCGEIPEKGGNRMEPVILVDCTSDMRIMQEETFGPVCCVMSVDSLSQAVELANDSEYGLGASLWSKDKKEGKQFGCEIESAVATINDCLYSFGEPSAPWGGVKNSGIGRTHSRLGLMEMVQPKYISRDNSNNRNLWWYPYDDDLDNFLSHAVIGLYHTNFWKKMKHSVRLAFFKRFWLSAKFIGLLKGGKRWF